MNIRLAQTEDLNIILDIYESARRFMREAGNPNQWGASNPPKSHTLADIEEHRLFVVADDDTIYGVFYFNIAEDPTYEVIYDGKWLNDKPYGVIHRIAVSDEARGKGVAGYCFDYAFEKCKNLKIDTHIDNIPMQKALAKHGFVKCGTIFLANGDKRIAFQKTEEY